MAHVDLHPTAVAAGGDAIARDEHGRVVFVEGALPGEHVRAELTDERRDFARARVVDVLVPSPGRVEPPCPSAAAGCGGCQWQHVDASWQRRLKRDIVVDALRRLAHVAEPPVARDVPAVPRDGYRTTLRLAVEGGRAVYRRRHGHDGVPVGECLVAHPALAELVVLGRFGARAREVVLRVSTTTGERLALVRPTVGADVALPPDVVVVGADDRKRMRRAALTETVAGRPWRVSVESFFQSGPAAAELVVAAVREAAGEVPGEAVGDGPVVDAYAGVGLLGGALAGAGGAGGPWAGRPVVAVEQHAGAVRDARRNLAELDAVVVPEEVAAWDAARVAPASLVVADPARPGLGRSAVRALAAADASVFVLVSCDPASMARDVGLLRAEGYRLESVRALDLFPGTFHVEAVARLCR